MEILNETSNLRFELYWVGGSLLIVGLLFFLRKKPIPTLDEIVKKGGPNNIYHIGLRTTHA